MPVSLAARLERDWRRFADPGFDGMDEDERNDLAFDYTHVDHPAAREVVQWLRGQSLVGEESLAP